MDVDKKNDDSKSPQEVLRKKVFRMIFIILLFDLLAFTCILPLLPALLDYYALQDQASHDPLYRLLQSSVSGLQSLLGIPNVQRFNSVLYGGILGSLFSFLQFIASPIIGALSDVYGRKVMLLITTFGIAVSYFVWSLSTTFTLFVIARVLGGISKGNVSLSTSVVTDVSDTETRGRGMAMVGIAFSVGFILGPLIGALFSSYAKGDTSSDFFWYPAMFALTFEVIDLLLIYFYLPETLPKNQRSKSLLGNLKESLHFIEPMHLFNFSAVQNMAPVDRSALKKNGLAYFTYLFFFSGLEFTLTFLTHSRLQYTSAKQGRMFFFIGLIMILVQGGYGRRIAKGKERRNAQLGILLTIPSFILIGFAHSATLLYSGLVLYALGTALVVPNMTTAVSLFGRNDQKGTVMGIFRSLGALARAFGPLFGSALYWILGPTLAYGIGGVLLFVPLWILK